MRRFNKKKVWKLGNLGLASLMAVSLAACGSASKSASFAVTETAVNYDMPASGAGGINAGLSTLEAYAEHGPAIPEQNSRMMRPEGEEYNPETADGSAYSHNRMAEGNQTGTDSESEFEQADKKLIRNVDLSFESENFDGFISSLEKKVQEYQGYIESSDISGNTEYQPTRNAYYTIRIPVQYLDQFLGFAESEGHLTRKYESTQDITLNYHDTELRKQTLETEQARLMELLGSAESVDAIIALEQRLSEIRYQLDQYESDLRHYDNQVQYSTVRVDVQETRVLSAGEEAGFGERVRQGFQQNLRKLGTDLVNFTVLVLSSIPQLIILGIVLSLGFLLGKKLLRRRRVPGTGKKE